MFNLCTGSGGAPKVDCTVSEPFGNHMQHMSQTNAMKRIERFISFSQHRVTVRGGCGRCTVTDGPSVNSHQSFAQLSKSEGPETKVSLSNDKKCVIQGYSINAVPKKADTNTLSNITTRNMQNDGTLRATFWSGFVRPSNQAASDMQKTSLSKQL